MAASLAADLQRAGVGGKPILSEAHSHLLGLAAFLLIVMSIPASVLYASWSSQRAEKSAWDIAGPPCPVSASPAAPSAGPRALKYEFDYGGVTFARRFGHVSCVAPRVHELLNRGFYRVCQFSGPATISVTTERRTVVFKPGVGRRATVTVRDGEPSCVLGGWFRG